MRKGIAWAAVTMVLAAGMAVDGTAEEEKSGVKRPMHLFILSGQSNMPGAVGRFFSLAVKKALPSAEAIVVRVAKGGQPIMRWYKKWELPQGTKLNRRHLQGGFYEHRGDLYDQLMAKVKVATGERKPVTITFVWMQGEQDAKAMYGKAYAESLAGLIAQLRDDLGRQDVNVVIGRLNDAELQNKRYKHWTIVRESQVKVAEADARTEWVDTDDLNGEKNGVHFTAKGYKGLAERFVAKAVELLARPASSNQ